MKAGRPQGLLRAMVALAIGQAPPQVRNLEQMLTARHNAISGNPAPVMPSSRGKGQGAATFGRRSCKPRKPPRRGRTRNSWRNRTRYAAMRW